MGHHQMRLRACNPVADNARSADRTVARRRGEKANRSHCATFFFFLPGSASLLHVPSLPAASHVLQLHVNVNWAIRGITDVKEGKWSPESQNNMKFAFALA